MMTATGVFGAQGLHLGSQVTVDYTSYRVDANASALFTDVITLGGGTPGASGYLRAVFDYDGSISCAGPIGAQCYASLTVNGVYNISGASRAGSAVFDIPFTLGVASPLSISLAARAVDQYSGTRFRANVDFLHSADLRFVQVLDSNRNVLTDGTVVSDGNLSYPMTAPVPEPASLLLLATGAAGIAARRGGRRRS
jgi:hypothetical protein